MLSPSLAHAAPRPSTLTPLEHLAQTGLLRCAVPARMGGDGGDAADLALAASLLLPRDTPAAAVFWAQRLAIEALVQSPNVALRELWLPDLLSGLRACTLSPCAAPLTGEDTGRGWLLSGHLPDVPNRPWEGFSLVAPLRLGDAPTGWALLRSEEDGLSALPCADPHTATLQLRRVYFREDEWLGEADLAQRMAPVASALAPFQPRPPAA
ncbi:acyl-CoA dehydrogenase family protein [Hydrogenophaga sp. RWCD_12]|uniref:acyl-CoA dehydrogenase family protein n=1 Tax=Hydrogenophaga sp. RWCD_12 TaxID=3391190 RepID=UPI0039847C5D